MFTFNLISREETTYIEENIKNKRGDEVIIKPCQIPYHVTQYQVFAQRLKSGLMKDIFEEKLRKGLAGYRGEKSIGYYLEFLPAMDYLIFHGLRLANGDSIFQMDCLILSQTFILLLEVKNIAGTITIGNGIRQLVREFNHQTDAFDDPLLQAEIHRKRLLYWLRKEYPAFPDLPIETLVVFASPGVIKTPNINPLQTEKIIRSSALEHKIEELIQKYPQTIASSDKLEVLSCKLLTSHRDLKINPFQTGKIKFEDIVKGVQCPRCHAFSMRWRQKNWHCPSCNFISKDAHIPALLTDYRLMCGTTITNAQCRDFLRLDSSDVSKYLLQSLCLGSVGNNRGRIYILPEN
ncbi:NERD domain-containing protein [Sporolactobacillus shoreae]|uniref:NERD domain-containing protein n=1 Tax=Sporolactobacillus shoreae TaxID=1465501 RepID=A0A4Z0GNZ8_9BACL|nr:NERD domain-containing protein [Sporolactobacillus shoreae]